MILTGRAVTAPEAEAWGLADRLTEPGGALGGALELAEQLAAFPQRCLRSDRASALDQWALPEWAALAHEITLGLETVRSGETREGAARFAAGEGRHGVF